MQKEWIPDVIEFLESSSMQYNCDDIESYGTDCWPVAIKRKQLNHTIGKPDIVVFPKNADHVSQILKWANGTRVPIVPWGMGSCVTGAGLPDRGGIVLDMSLMKSVIFLDKTNLMVKVEAGMFGWDLEQMLDQQGYTLNHSPQSLDRSSVGGWIATRAMGQFSSRWGGMEDLCISFTVVLPEGEIVELPLSPRASLGPDLRQMFMGSEGALGVITDVTLKIFPKTERRILEAVVFDHLASGLNSMRRIMQSGLRPFLIRFYDEDESRHAMKQDDFEGCVLFLGCEGISSVAQAEFRAGIDICIDEQGKRLGTPPVEAWMKRRFDFSAVEGILEQPGGVAETIEIAHFWDFIPETYDELKKELAPYVDEVLCHFSHTYGHGTSMYLILLGEEENAEKAEKQILKLWDVAMKVCLRTGASLAHHHGIGLARQPYMKDALGVNMLIIDKMKQVFDPNNIMNPGKWGGKYETVKGRYSKPN